METKVNELLAIESTDKGLKHPLQVEFLQKINHAILTDYMIQIDDSFRLYPIEVEAYYYHKDKFKDPYTHRSELQKNRFGKLYFHRATKAKKKEDTISWGKFGGVDICLSSPGEYYLGILIRSAWINEEKEPVCGPNLLKKRIIRHYTGKKDDNKITPEEFEKIRELEETEKRLVLATNDKREKKPLFCGCRYGIDPENDPEFFQYKLRLLIELNEPNHPFKDKGKVDIFCFEKKGDENSPKEES
jgi:hypothetical protein